MEFQRIRGGFVAVAAVLLTLACVPSAGAQCDIERSPKAKKLSFSLVQALDDCPGIAYPAPNTTISGIPACAPSPPPKSQYTFGPKGGCDVRLVHRPGSELAVRVKCKDVLDGASATDGETGWQLRIEASVTQQAATYSVVPVRFEFPPSDDGTLSMAFTTSELENPLTGWPPLPLSSCTSIQFASQFTESMHVSIVDPAGDTFALPGTTIGNTATPCSLAAATAVRAKGIKSTSLVRAFDTACPDAYPVYYPCDTPTPLSSRRFNDKNGACKLSLAQREEPCTSNPAASCAPIAVTLKCNGLEDSGGLSLNEAGWHLDFWIAATLDDGVVEASIIHLPMRFDLPAIVDGRAALDATRFDLVDPVEYTIEIPACSVLTLFAAELFDADDALFARLGTASFPK